MADEPSLTDPSKILDTLKKIVAGNTETKESANSAQPPATSSKSWVSTIILVLVALAGVALWAWISWRQGKELAALRHEKNKVELLKEQAELKKKVAQYLSTIDKAEQQIEESTEKVRLLEADIKAEEARLEANMHAIHSITSWSDAGVR
jgi:uncharacterized protein HemX